MTIIIDFLTKRATAVKWKTLNTVLRSGQFGYEKDTGLLKIGDGSTAWNNLSYLVTKNNLTAIRDPVSSDYAGYSAGSMWFNRSTGVFFVCTANTGTSAEWTDMANGYGC